MFIRYDNSMRRACRLCHHGVLNRFVLSRKPSLGGLVCRVCATRCQLGRPCPWRRGHQVDEGLLPARSSLSLSVHLRPLPVKMFLCGDCQFCESESTAPLPGNRGLRTGQPHPEHSAAQGKGVVPITGGRLLRERMTEDGSISLVSLLRWYTGSSGSEHKASRV